MTFANHAGNPTKRATRPISTWALMLRALVTVLILPDWAESGKPRPIWTLVVPILVGMAGAILALKDKHPWRAAVSALWVSVL